MLCQEEESRILAGIDRILFDMNHIDVEDIAYFMVKYEPNLAEKLATALEFNILDKDYRNVR